VETLLAVALVDGLAARLHALGCLEYLRHDRRAVGGIEEHLQSWGRRTRRRRIGFSSMRASSPSTRSAVTLVNLTTRTYTRASPLSSSLGRPCRHRLGELQRFRVLDAAAAAH
jgi:hypothetical protein